MPYKEITMQWNIWFTDLRDGFNLMPHLMLIFLPLFAQPVRMNFIYIYSLSFFNYSWLCMCYLLFLTSNNDMIKLLRESFSDVSYGLLKLLFWWQRNLATDFSMLYSLCKPNIQHLARPYKNYFYVSWIRPGPFFHISNKNVAKSRDHCHVMQVAI